MKVQFNFQERGPEKLKTIQLSLRFWKKHLIRLPFHFINFQNERFTILKSDMTTNEKNEFVIHIKEARFSSPRYENCIFSTGEIILSDVSQNKMKLNLKSVGPTCFISYDVLMNMDDIKDVILIKEKSNK